MKLNLHTLFLSLLLLFASGQALACQMAGKNSHIGTVVTVDRDSFTIIDAETQQRLSFRASPQLLAMLPLQAQVKIAYVVRGETLVTRSLTYI